MAPGATWLRTAASRTSTPSGAGRRGGASAHGLSGMYFRAAALGLLLLACEAPVAPPASPPAPDKRALYGDPALVPTRAGERAREELALAGSVAAAVRARADVGALAVEVRLPAGADPGAVVIAGAVALPVDDVARIAEGVVGPWSAGRVQVELGPAPTLADEPPARLGWALALALLGLGGAAGVALDRGIARRRQGGREGQGGVGGRRRRLYASPR